MAKQTLLFTALPNGYSDDRSSVRLSVFVSPRLDPEAAPAKLSSFGDFIDWPATLRQSKFVVHFAAPPDVTIHGDNLAGQNRIDDSLGIADSGVWQAMFTGETCVSVHEIRDLPKHAVLSYPAAASDVR